MAGVGYGERAGGDRTAAPRCEEEKVMSRVCVVISALSLMRIGNGVVVGTKLVVNAVLMGGCSGSVHMNLVNLVMQY
jgi:hypothetical protein